MSRLNTMYPDDEFLKNISDMMGKLDNKNETEIKQEIEQIGYKEFYRYSKEKDVYIKQLKEEKQELINLLDMFKNQQKEFIEYLENKKISPRGNSIEELQYKKANQVCEERKNLEQALDEIEKYMTNYIKVEDGNENVKIEFNELLKIIQKAKGDSK